jgi:hypothetical protein
MKRARALKHTHSLNRVEADSLRQGEQLDHINTLATSTLNAG